MPKKIADYTGLKKKSKKAYGKSFLKETVTPVIGAVTVLELAKLIKK